MQDICSLQGKFARKFSQSSEYTVSLARDVPPHAAEAIWHKQILGKLQKYHEKVQLVLGEH